MSEGSKKKSIPVNHPIILIHVGCILPENFKWFRQFFYYITNMYVVLVFEKAKGARGEFLAKVLLPKSGSKQAPTCSTFSIHFSSPPFHSTQVVETPLAKVSRFLSSS